VAGNTLRACYGPRRVGALTSTDIADLLAVVDNSITRHPYLYGIERNDEFQVLAYRQGGMLRHGEGAKMWSPLSAVFELEEGAVGLNFQLNQASRAGDPPDGTRAAFDDVEVRLFVSKEEAEAFVYNEDMATVDDSGTVTSDCGSVSSEALCSTITVISAWVEPAAARIVAPTCPVSPREEKERSPTEISSSRGVASCGLRAFRPSSCPTYNWSSATV